jgi:peptide/nickel transport system permease protein
MSLLPFLLRRFAGFVAVMVGVSIITFGLSHLVPADPAIVALGDHATDSQIDAFREKYGLNKPVPEQYWIYVTDLLHGDLGISLRTRRPVASDLRDFFPATFELALTALLFSILIGVPAGVFSATKRNRLPDHTVRVVSLIGGSVPIFWLGLMLISLFYGRLGWLPGGARIDKFIPPPPTVTGLFTVDSLLAGNFKAFGSSVHYRPHDALEHAGGDQPAVCAGGAGQGPGTGQGRLAPCGPQRHDPHGDDDRDHLRRPALGRRPDRDHF